jgi:leucyl aminopeptidase
VSKREIIFGNEREQALEFSIKSGSPEKQRSDCVVVGIYESRQLSASAELIEKASQGALTRVLRRGDMDGKLGSTVLLHHVVGIEAERVLLVGLGKEAEFRDAEYRKAVAAAIRQLNETGSADATLYLAELSVGKRDVAWCIRQAVLVASDALYSFNELKSKAKAPKKGALRKIVFSLTRPEALKAAEAALSEGIAIASGVDWAKNLGNLPGNICTPTYLADQAKALAKEFKLDIDVFDSKKMARLGMHSLLSVAKGSIQPPRFIVLKHPRGKAGDKPLILVGKGITFDSGGISLKPGPEMDEMKYDMCGAASVLGAMRAAAMLKLPLNIIALIPTTENMPGGAASNPGDIVTSMSGQTIEILNTDAEGRLILCDALTYAERFEPDCVVDVATLTGACVIALGHVATGLFANDDDLGKELLDAGQDACDRAWQMPLWDDYQEQLKSNFADMANIGGRPAGSITAASFLARFTKKYPWAHLDIAGTAWKSGKDKGSTGRPVALLTHFLMQRSAHVKPAVGKRPASKATKADQ